MSNFESQFNLVMFCSFRSSGSMEPAFHRGDLLFLTNRVEDPIRVGEIVVFRIEGREIPIVHRVLKIHEKYMLIMFSI
jgi:signal peptidase I